MQSPNKLKRLCFHYHNASCHQTCQAGAIPRGASTHEFKISVNQVVFWSYVTNQNIISPLAQDPRIPN